MIDIKLTKPVDSVSTNIIENREEVTNLIGTGLTISKCVRDNAETIFIDPGNRANYFSSFGLTTSDTQITTGSTISFLYPELYQTTTDKFVLININKSDITELIDARSIRLEFSYSVSLTQVVLYSSTYTGDKAFKYGETSPLFGDNIAYLFSDSFNRPYSGLTVNELGEVVSRSAVTSWNPTNQYKDRPGAISYREVQANSKCLNSDRRPSVYYSNAVQPGYPQQLGQAVRFSNSFNSAGNLAFTTDSTHSFVVGDSVFLEFDSNPLINSAATITTLTSNTIKTNIAYSIGLNGLTGNIYKGYGTYYNYDIPLGFVCLDRGIIVLTHKNVVDNFVFSIPGVPGDGFYQDGTAVGGLFNLPLENIYWTGGSLNVSYTKINDDYKTSVACSALINEFYISNNRTWDKSIANNSLSDTPPVQITEAGFYNALGELIGISKFSEPIQKNQSDIIAFDFNVDM